jgi:hypothetical protein
VRSGRLAGASRPSDTPPPGEEQGGRPGPAMTRFTIKTAIPGACSFLPHCDSDGARARSHRELARARGAHAPIMQSVRPSALLLVVEAVALTIQIQTPPVMVGEQRH